MCLHVGIGFNVSHRVCTSTATCMSMHIYNKVCVLRACLPKPNVLHACIAFDPCMCVYVNRQHNPCASMVTYIHVSICAFDPSTNASIYVNRHHNALSTTTCVHKCQHRLHHHVCTSTTTFMSMHIYNRSLCLACMSTKP